MNDVAGIVDAYGATVHNEDVVFIPAQGAKAEKLIVLFSAMDQNNKFNRLSWFSSGDEKIAFLFLRDGEYTYYLGTEDRPRYHTYEKIIDHFAGRCGLDRASVYCVGSSMGGYAAILFAARMRLAAAIVGVPQVAKRFARMHSYGNWVKAMNASGSLWLELDEFLYRPDIKLPPLYVEFGRYPADHKAAEALLEIYRERGGIVVSCKGEAASHTYFLSADVILSTVSYLCGFVASRRVS